MVVQAQALATPIGSLRDTTVLTTCSIGMWSGIKSDKALRNAAATGTGTLHHMVNASKHLVAEDAIKALRARAAAYKFYWRQQTAPWMDDGRRIMRGAGLVRVKAQMSAYQDEWNDTLVPAFVAQYPALVNDARALLGPTVFNTNDYPSVNAIASRFYFRFSAECLPSFDDWRIAGISQAELDQIRADTESAYRQQIAASQADTWARLREPIAHMAETLANYTGGRNGSFHHTLVTNVADILNMLPNLNLTADPMLDSIAALARQLTIYSGDELRKDPVARENTQELSAELTAQMDAFI